ncbi:hypothetical protein [Amycolatopsis sp. NPDC003731]
MQKIDQEVWDLALAHYTRLHMGPGCTGSDKLRDALQAIIPIIERKARIDELTRWLSNLPQESPELEQGLIARLEELGVKHDE